MMKPLQIIMLLFGFYLLYQIIRKLLGGSWSTEEVILGLLLFNIGVTITTALLLTKLQSDHDHLQSDYHHLKSQFASLATDVKAYLLKK